MIIEVIAHDEYTAGRVQNKFGGRVEDLGRSLRHPMRRWKVTMPYGSDERYALVRKHVKAFVQNGSVDLIKGEYR